MIRRKRGKAILVAMFLSALIPAAAPAGEPPRGGAPMESLGERIFLGKAGPWAVEARLIDMKAQLAKSGVSEKAIARLSAKHHLMVILSDPKTGKTPADAAGEVTIAGPDPNSSSKVSLVVMGGHIGADVSLPKPGIYRFRLAVGAGNSKGSASFEYSLRGEPAGK